MRAPFQALLKLGNRAALGWVVDQYRGKTGGLSGIMTDPTGADDLQYILWLIGKVISVSLETVKTVGGRSLGRGWGIARRDRGGVRTIRLAFPPD